MGGNHSKISQESITNVIIQSVIEVTQSTSLITKASSDIKIDTTKANEIQGNQRFKCIDIFLRNNKDPGECIVLYPTLTVNNIFIKGVYNINSTITQVTKLTQQQQTDILNKITSQLTQKNEGIQIGNTAEENIKTFVDINIQSILKAAQDAKGTTDITNSVVITGGGVSGVTIDSFVDEIRTICQSDEVFQKNSLALTNDLESTLTQTSSLFGGLGGLITMIIVGIFGFFVILFMILFLIKYFKSKPTKIESTKSEPTKSEPTKIEPTKIEQKKTD